MPRADGLGLDLGKQLLLARQPQRHRSAGRDRQDRAVPARRVLQSAVAVVIHHGVGEGSQRRNQRTLEPGLHADEVLQQSDRVARVAGEEPRAGRLFDVAAASLEQVLARLHPPARLGQLFDPVHELAPLVVELIAPLRQRGGLAVHLLDVGLGLTVRGLRRSDPLADARELVRDALVLPLGAGQRTLRGLGLGATTGCLLADPTADLLHLPPVILGFAIGNFGEVELRLLRLELGDDLAQPALDTGDLGRDRVHARGAGGLGRELLARPRLAIDRGAERLLRPLPIERGGPERPLCLRLRAGGLGTCVRRREHVGVQGVQARAGGPPLLEPLVPAALSAILLTLERAQTRGGERPSERIGLLRELLVLLGGLGLLLQRLATGDATR